MISGGPIANFTGGWALIPFAGHKVHFWREVTVHLAVSIGRGGRNRFYRSACKLNGVTNDQVHALKPGEFDTNERCKNCLRRRAKVERHD